MEIEPNLYDFEFPMIDNQLWWITNDEVYFAYYKDSTLTIFKFDKGIPNLMIHK